MTPASQQGATPEAFDLGQHLFDTAVAMNKVQRAALGITPLTEADLALLDAPRERALYVRDDHVQALLIAMTDHLIRQRQLKVEPTLAEREMLAVLTDMVQS